MTDLIPQAFPLPSDPAVASYNYVDIANGLGYAIYYAIVWRTETTSTYALIPTAEYSGITQLDFGTYSFDTSVFNTQRTAKGNAFVSVCYVSNACPITTFNITLYRVPVSGAAVAICSTASATLGCTNNVPEINSVQLPLTETDFKVGEKLRLTIAASETGVASFGTDPANRDGSTINPSSDDPPSTTVLKVGIPFKIDI